MGTDDSKPEYPPLLEPGRHAHTVDELTERCVTAFQESKTRKPIMDGLVAVINRLNEVGIIGELWVDGSFLTSKPDPDDADVVLRVQASFVDSCTQDQYVVLGWVAGNLRESHRCHSFVFTEWPEGHENHWAGEYAYCFWMKQWGFSRPDENEQPTLKGMALIQLSGVQHE